MKLMIGGLMAGLLLLSGTPAVADSWQHERGRHWGHYDKHWDKQRERQARHWRREHWREHERMTHRHYYAPPAYQHRPYYGHSYGNAIGGHVGAPGFYLYWSN